MIVSPEPQRRRLAAVSVVWCAVLACLFVGAPLAIGKNSRALRVVALSASVTRARQAYLVVHSPTSSPCALSLLRGKRVVTASPSKRPGSTHEVEFTWVFSAATPNGRWGLRVRCGGAAHTVGTMLLSGAGGAAARASRVPSIVAVALSSGKQPAITEPPFRAPPTVYPKAGSVIVAANSWFGGHGVDVLSNGAPAATGKHQSVELFERFVDAQGWYKGLVGSGEVGAQAFYALAPSSVFVKHANGSGYVPVPGDAVIFGGVTPTGQPSGHVAIVQSVTPKGVTLVEQNASATGLLNITRTGSRLGGDTISLTAIGTLHATKNTHLPMPTTGQPSTVPQAPTTPPDTTGGYEIAFQNAAGHLATYSPAHGYSDLNLAMAPNTGAGIATLTTGAHEIAIQDATSHLTLVADTTPTITSYTMSAGRSPGVTSVAQADILIDYVNAAGNLHRYFPRRGSDSAFGYDYAISPGTDASFAPVVTGAYVYSLQDIDCTCLHIIETGGDATTPEGGVPGSPMTLTGASPSIAESADGFTLAYATPADTLATMQGTLTAVPFSTTTPDDTGQAIAPGTNPSIAASTNGYEVAYETPAGHLAVDSASGPVDLGLAMAPAASPTIVATRDGSYRIAYQAANGDLAAYSPGTGATDLGQPMAAGTSPSISP